MEYISVNGEVHSDLFIFIGRFTNYADKNWRNLNENNWRRYPSFYSSCCAKSLQDFCMFRKIFCEYYNGATPSVSIIRQQNSVKYVNIFLKRLQKIKLKLNIVQEMN